MDLDTVLLRSFLQTAERGTVAAAAHALGYTAPAVSQHIGKLETQVGSPLFDRIAGRLRLSQAGTRLVPVARDILDIAERVPLVATTADRRRHVVIAGFASAISTLVVPLLSSPLRKRITMEVREAEDDEALRGLRLGEIDIALTQEYEGSVVARDRRLRYSPLLSDRLRVVAPPMFAPNVKLAELAERGWLVNGAGTRCEEATERILVAAGITPRITGRIADNSALLRLVAAGHGAAIVPERVLGETAYEVTVARVDLSAARSIVAVTRAAAATEHAPIVEKLTVIARRRITRPT